MTNCRTHGKWWERAFLGLHYDIHATKDDKNLGANLTEKHLQEQIEKVRPDFIQCDGKGHPGYTSYPTHIGSAAPGLKRDMLRIYRNVASKMNIPLSVHYSGLIDLRAVELHKDWGVIGHDGNLLAENGRTYVCRLSPYIEELMIPQILEIIDIYDIDGFWIDGDNWGVRDCYCTRCRSEFLKRTGLKAPDTRTHPDWPLWRAFQRDTFIKYVKKYTDAVHREKPDCAVCSNWMYTLRQPGEIAVPVDYLSGDFSPSFGYERAVLEGRYIDCHHKPWNLMSWTGCFTGENLPKQFKTAVHLCQEASAVISCGGGIVFYDNPQRDGTLVDWHHDVLAETANFCRERQAFTQNTFPLPDTAVLLSNEHVWSHNTEPFCVGKGYFGMAGALNILSENHLNVDILDNSRLLKKIKDYNMVVAGEQNPISQEVESALKDYAKNGGTVIISGGHVARKHGRLTGVKAIGPVLECSFPLNDFGHHGANANCWYIQVRNKAIPLGGTWQKVKLLDAETLSFLMNGEQPGKDETNFPAVTVRTTGKGQIVAIHGDIMQNYFLTRHPLIRVFMADLMDSLKIKKRMKTNAPPGIDIFLRYGENALFIHMVNKGANPSLNPYLHVVENIPPAKNIILRLKVDKKPKMVSLEPGSRRIKYRFLKGLLTAEVKEVRIHEILVMKF